MSRSTPLAFAALLVLAACGEGTPADDTAEALEEAADVSTDAAAPILENAADRVEEQPAQANAIADQALRQAGNAQAGTENVQ